MKQTTIRLDEQVHAWLVQMAAERHVSLSHLINDALGRFVAGERAFERMEERARRACPGTMRRALEHTAARGLPPLHPEDRLPSDFNRGVLEKRLMAKGDSSGIGEEKE
jgi:hypothetical protein